MDNFGDEPECHLLRSAGSSVVDIPRLTGSIKRGEGVNFSIGCGYKQTLGDNVDELTVTINNLPYLEKQDFEFPLNP